MNLRIITIVISRPREHEIFIPEMVTKDFHNHNINKTKTTFFFIFVITCATCIPLILMLGNGTMKWTVNIVFYHNLSYFNCLSASVSAWWDYVVVAPWYGIRQAALLLDESQ